jgi:hypothetical protein
MNMTEMESNWKGLYRTVGVVTVILLVYSLVTMALMFTIGGQPESAQESFTMLQQNRLAGLLRLDLLTVLVWPLYYLLFLGLFAALKKTHMASAAVALVLGIAGVTLLLATPSVFSWLALYDKFAVATSEAQKTLLLTVGESILASDMWHGTGARMGGLLLQTGTLLASILMLRSTAFGKFTSWVGIATHGLDLLHILVGFFLPAGGVVLMMVAGPLYLIWFPLLARDFFRLGRD